MAVEIVPVNPAVPERAVIARAAEAILRGGVVGFPTDTFYGLGCSLMDPAAVDMVYQLKRRPPDLAVISLIADPAQVEALAAEIPEIGEALMKRFWPGPLSIVFRASPLLSTGSRGPRDTVALRFPRHPISIALVLAVGGPVVASSANLSGQPPARTAQDVARTFGNQLDLILDGGAAQAQEPSTLVDVSRGRLAVLRPGSVDVSAHLPPGA